MVRVKICGLTRLEDAELAIELGADALGFVFEPSSPRFVGASDAVSIPDRLGPFVTTVAVYSGYQPSPLDGSCSLVQLLDGDPCQRPHIRGIRFPKGMTPSVAIEKIDVSIAESEPVALLIDAYHPSLGGGTGEKADWVLASEIVGHFDQRKIILAGGLTPENVAEAVRMVRPYAVDVSSGVEVSPGIKDPVKMRDFIQAAKG